MTKDKNIFIHNIYYMLSYAFSALRQSTYESLATEKFENVYDIFAAILAKGINHQLKQGLYRTYAERKETLPVLRGKVDLTGSMRSLLQGKRALACDYDEFSENNLLNQVIKCTAMLLIRHSKVENVYKDELKKQMLYFSGVDEISPLRIPWQSIRIHRNNQTYRMLIGICRLTLEDLLLTTESGDFRLASFLDEQQMCRLYEKFILEYYRQEFPVLNASASRIPWALDDENTELLPAMQSDIMISYKEKVMIIDAKYYSHTLQSQYNVYSIHSQNLYQIFAYVKNKEAEMAGRKHEVSGMLLYARTDEVIQPDVTYKMSGNRISVKTLDLNRNFSEIKRQLDEIADTCLLGKGNE